MRRSVVTMLCCGASLSLTSGSAPAEPPVSTDAGGPLPDVQWTLHVLHRPGSQDVRLPLEPVEGVIPVRKPWQCSYRRTTLEPEDLVKIKCLHESGAVVGTVAMCRREIGQSDLAQLSIGVDGVAAYETLDLSCTVARDRGHVVEGAHDQRR